MRNAIKDAGIEPSAIGTSTPTALRRRPATLAETMALKSAMGRTRYKTMVSSTNR